MKLVALFKEPQNIEGFNQAYFDTHIPLIRSVPGLRKLKISRFTRTLMGETFYLMAEMSIDGKESLKAAMQSPEMDAAGKNLDTFARGLVSLMFAEDE